jgi:hypothetical protein
MSSKDLDYAANLVNGVRVLNLFGDLTMELTFRYDGDKCLLIHVEN